MNRRGDMKNWIIGLVIVIVVFLIIASWMISTKPALFGLANRASNTLFNPIIPLLFIRRKKGSVLGPVPNAVIVLALLILGAILILAFANQYLGESFSIASSLIGRAP